MSCKIFDVLMNLLQQNSIVAQTGDPASVASPRERPTSAYQIHPLTGHTNRKLNSLKLVVLLLTLGLSASGGGCFEGQQGDRYYGRVIVPRAQEFRWSDGGLPKIFDPALAAVPPDTDVVRAMFEGLTDYDPRSLKPVSGVATRWESSADKRVWTFYLRSDARWSNGDPVTAHDFVRSWQRTLRFGERAPHARLMQNIEGAQATTAAPSVQPPSAASPTASAAPSPVQPSPIIAPPLAVNSDNARAGEQGASSPANTSQMPPVFGAEAINDHVLKVRLQHSDEDFAALVAHPVFRPVHTVIGSSENRSTDEQSSANDSTAGEGESDARIVSNGAFTLAARETDSVLLERTGSYWDVGAVKLKRVRFVSMRDGEEALAAYGAGQVDAVSNASFEPLALKLLAPYEDFDRATYGALTYYAFNTTRSPFDDLRVRRALAISIDRERLSADTLEGRTEAATRFLPFPIAVRENDDSSSNNPDKTSQDADARLGFDPKRARQLMTEAGFPGGDGFPTIKLLVNRNDQQRLLAQAIAGMWRNVLGVETEITVRAWDEYEAAIRAGDYDIARRSVVMPTIGEKMNLLAMFEPPAGDAESVYPAVALAGDGSATSPFTSSATAHGAPPVTTPGMPLITAPVTPTPHGASPSQAAASAQGNLDGQMSPGNSPAVAPVVLSEAQALRELPAMPIYFATSNILVKPYVEGFQTNLLDAPILKYVRIDTGWKQSSTSVPLIKLARRD